jgi:hypothetical protein
MTCDIGGKIACMLAPDLPSDQRIKTILGQEKTKFRGRARLRSSP